MPLYEYQCTECEATLEAIQAFSAPPLEECPECGQSSLRKLLSAPAFQFKGSGWYVNDYARKDKNGSAEASSNGSSANGNGSEGKAEAGKSEKKSDSSASSAKSESSTSAAT
ncbi:MAG: zinc ribbon domain-containing protein [Holophagales bacterium]|nr:zinc ribbon domain-containing protein [Holophagales bacterium]MYG30804.1 zinc ribbon domain-containing protein [Holophagales bacterium]MYI81744.1 zinc ribbon domain-containing protein [Holophagales bacterium]